MPKSRHPAPRRRPAGYACAHQPQIVQLEWPGHPVTLCAACAIRTSEALNTWRRSIGDPLAPVAPDNSAASTRLAALEAHNGHA